MTLSVFLTKIGEVQNKIPVLSNLVTPNVLDVKVKVESKIPVVSDLVKKMPYNARISDNEGKFITTSDYNKFMCDIPDAKINEKELVNKSDISNRVINSVLSTRLATLATKSELSYDLSYFLGKNFFAYNGSQNMFVYQPTLSALQLRKDKVIN